MFRTFEPMYIDIYINMDHYRFAVIANVSCTIFNDRYYDNFYDNSHIEPVKRAIDTIFLLRMNA